MADQNNYTTIRIKESSRKKLESLRDGTSLTFSDIIENLLSDIDGTIKDDVTNVHRESVAFQLQYTDFETNQVRFRDVTFKDAKNLCPGQRVSVVEFPSAHCQFQVAECLLKDDESVLIRITETVRENHTEKQYADVLHIELF